MEKSVRRNRPNRPHIPSSYRHVQRAQTGKKKRQRPSRDAHRPVTCRFPAASDALARPVCCGEGPFRDRPGDSQAENDPAVNFFRRSGWAFRRPHWRPTLK